MMTNIAAASYTLAAVAYLVLGVLLLTSWRGRLHGMVLPIACLLSVLWAAALAYQASHDFALSLVTDILEIARNAGWSAFLITLLGLNRDGFFNGRMNPAMSHYRGVVCGVRYCRFLCAWKPWHFSSAHVRLYQQYHYQCGNGAARNDTGGAAVQKHAG